MHLHKASLQVLKNATDDLFPWWGLPIGGSDLGPYTVQCHSINDKEYIVLQEHMLATAAGAARGALLAEETG
jgi:hypothetical protein